MLGGPENMRDTPDNDNNQVRNSFTGENVAETIWKVQTERRAVLRLKSGEKFITLKIRWVLFF